MGYQEKVNRTMSKTTSLSKEQALAKARAAIEELGSVRTWRLRVTNEGPGWFTVTIKPTVAGMLQEPTQFKVTAKDVGDKTTVSAKISDYSVYQEKLLWFIPVGPKQVPGVVAYQRSLERLDAAL